MAKKEKEIKVYLQYPWKFPDSSYYNSIMNYPPRNVKYINANKKKYIGINSPKRFNRMVALKDNARKILGVMKIPNLTLTRNKEFDIIHCAHCLSLNKRPWVTDTEHYWNFAASSEISYSSIGKKRIIKLLKSKYCKKIMPWTESAMETVLKATKDKEIEEKTEIVTYAIPPPKIKKIKHDGINLFFSGRYFYQKGGPHALAAIDALTRKYDNVKAIFLSQTPDEIRMKYEKNKKIEFHNLMPLDKIMKEIYPMSDIFILPGYSDSFGFPLVEALAFGLPVVTVDGFARKDIIEDGKDGFVIKKPKITWKITGPCVANETQVIKDIIKKASLLIESSSLRKKMSNYGIKTTSEGRFSLKKRQNKLKSIYEESLIN
jgi:glycosyltransferase involved in cell wall biosynthesis